MAVVNVELTALAGDNNAPLKALVSRTVESDHPERKEIHALLRNLRSQVFKLHVNPRFKTIVRQSYYTDLHEAEEVVRPAPPTRRLACATQRSPTHASSRVTTAPHAACRVHHASCRMPRAACLVPHASCVVPRATYLVPRAPCVVRRASCVVPRAACLVYRAMCRMRCALCVATRASGLTRVAHLTRPSAPSLGVILR